MKRNIEKVLGTKQLKWVKPFDRVESILKNIEAQLIDRHKPELNTHHAQADNAKWPVLLHIQNFSGISLFLHDELCRKALQ
ncbi:hypothetical protein FBR06_08805 [Betaproteobacteria bacterium PRO4]|uniref:hypothetical protein n=1 Tax=Nitrosomonas sp. TaxID=42353 RepID=UPI00256B487A|nr:hypothetical protein [Nitrosomonas sp.]MBE7526264.1 hypothetical protein [Burkholderiales bacterium]MDL1867315.1 hypothetical protein [Betaproteobacteria bacterium PRO4]